MVAARAIVINSSGSILFGKTNEDEWRLPGGKVEPGEPIDVAFLRELWEESGIEKDYIDSAKTTFQYLDTQVYLVKLDSSPKLPIATNDPDGEFTVLKWFPRKSLPENMSEYTEDIIYSYLAQMEACGGTIEIYVDDEKVYEMDDDTVWETMPRLAQERSRGKKISFRQILDDGTVIESPTLQSSPLGSGEVGVIEKRAMSALENKSIKGFDLEYDQTPQLIHEIIVYKDGKYAAELQVVDDAEGFEGQYYVLLISVEKEHRRKGLASSMYDWMEEILGEPLVGSVDQTPEAKKFWESRSSLNKDKFIKKVADLLFKKNFHLPGGSCGRCFEVTQAVTCLARELGFSDVEHGSSPVKYLDKPGERGHDFIVWDGEIIDFTLTQFGNEYRNFPYPYRASLEEVDEIYYDVEVYPGKAKCDEEDTVYQYLKDNWDESVEATVNEQKPHVFYQCPHCPCIEKCKCSQKVHDKTGVIQEFKVCDCCKDTEEASAAKQHTCYVFWPVTILGKTGGGDKNYHVTCKYFGKVGTDLDDILEILSTCDIRPPSKAEVEITTEVFDTENDGDVPVILLINFPDRMRKTHDALEVLQKDKYDEYKPHITVPPEIWEEIDKLGLDAASLNIEIGNLCIKHGGKIHKVTNEISSQDANTHVESLLSKYIPEELDRPIIIIDEAPHDNWVSKTLRRKDNICIVINKSLTGNLRQVLAHEIIHFHLINSLNDYKHGDDFLEIAERINKIEGDDYITTHADDTNFVQSDFKKTISVDFDGTVVATDFPEIGGLKVGVVEALTKLQEKYKIVIFSCRSNNSGPRTYHEDMVAYLDENGVPYDEVDDGTSGKIFAEFYIDDKAIRFENNWETIAKKILNEL